MPQGNRGLMRLFLAGREGMLTAEFDRDWCEIRRDGRQGPAPRCRRRRVDLPWPRPGRGAGRPGSRAEIRRSIALPAKTGATSVAVIAGLLASAAAGGAPQAIARAEAPR